MPRRLLLAPITWRFLILNYEKRQTQKRTLARNNEINDFEPSLTGPCVARHSAAPTANYYSAFDWTFWPIYGPGTRCLLSVSHQKESRDCRKLIYGEKDKFDMHCKTTVLIKHKILTGCQKIEMQTTAQQNLKWRNGTEFSACSAYRNVLSRRHWLQQMSLTAAPSFLRVHRRHWPQHINLTYAQTFP